MSSTTPVVSGAPLEQKPLAEVERVVDTFVAPRKTFSDLRRSANWFVPWLLLAIAYVAMTFVVDKKLGMEKVVDNQMVLQPKAAAKLDQLTAEQRATQTQTMTKFTRAIAYASPVVMVIILAIIAAVLMATFNQSLAVCMYASLPGILKALIAMLAILVGGGEGFTFQNPVASNLSGLVDPSSHFLYSITTSLDVITIWTLVLTGIGIACLTKVKPGACLGVVFGWWALVVLAGAGIGAAFS